jgi:hypothetical protein
MKPDSYSNQSWIKEIMFLLSFFWGGGGGGCPFDSLFLSMVTTDVRTRFFEISKCVLLVLVVF